MNILYRTTQGDAWDSIAYKLWPHVKRPELLMHKLMEANQEHMDVLVFSAGVELNVPEIPQPQTIIDIPAWRLS